MRSHACATRTAVLGALLVLSACTADERTPTTAPSVTAAATAGGAAAPAVGPTGAPPSDPATASSRPSAAEAARAPSAVDVLTVRADDALRFAPAFEPAQSAAGLTLTLTRAERRASAPDATAAERAEAGFRAQLAYRQLAGTPSWQAEVLDALPPDLLPVAEDNLAARAALDLLRAEGEQRRGGPATTLPAWTIVPPAPADELVQHYRDAADTIGVEWEYLAAINLVETRMGRIRGTSTAGARGPMQFIPSSWDIFGQGDIDDERDSIFAAARHLRQRGWDVSPREALYRYNNSDHYVDAVEAYAQVLAARPDTYLTYHGWQVFYTTGEGSFLLPVGYEEGEPVPLEDYLARDVVEVSG